MDRTGRDNGSQGRLTEAELALLATWREVRGGGRPASRPRLDPVEEALLGTWRAWRDSPASRPPWAARLQHRLADDVSEPAPATGLADGSGFLPEAPSRFLGMLLGGAVGEFVARGDRGAGQRGTATMFALEGLIRAHTRLRTAGDGDPVDGVLEGLQRWMHSRGVPWQDCGSPRPNPDGWLVERGRLRSRSTDEPTLLTALAAIAAGKPRGTRQQPVNASDAATAVPLGALAALWSGEAVFPLACDLAALTHGHPHGHNPAGVIGVAVSALLRDVPLAEAIQRGLAAWHSPTLAHALRLGLSSPAGALPARRHLDSMGEGRSGLGALAVAIRVATACPDDFAAAVRIAADHGGDTASSAMLCGQLLGALHGPTAIPAEWLAELPEFRLLERLATDAAAEFGPHPDESGEWARRYPTEDPHESQAPVPTALTSVPRLAASRDRFVGAVLGCAVGEALGGPVAGAGWDEIRDRHGANGLRSYVPAGHPAGRLGSDTQLMLFSLEGMIRAGVARERSGITDPSRHVQHAYQRWLHTQHLSWARAAGEFLRHTPEPDGWLVRQRALFQTRNPGRTMMRTLIAFAKGQQEMGTPQNPVSDSKGSTAVMRAVPAALWSDDPAAVFTVGMNIAALTHGDPLAYLSAGTLAYLVAALMDGAELADAAEAAMSHLGRRPGHEEVTRRLSAAVRLARSGPAPAETVEATIGSGWNAPEALGIGLYAALASEGEFDVALPMAVNHSGNSATTGAVCGSLVGAARGAEAIPDRWIADLELHEVIEQLAQDATLEFGPRPPRGPDWLERYPAT
ncbi:ADP-ribosylglycohydrolase [Saccharopolyspora erythraea NRRL 2338]|uniref:ADP-ribosylglycohydrolase n=2 Tax=Saccharopolyspora erythraea TaxID=1836 RepID=A4F9R4_SACEN|nr:ADP-ribosylglycohydrolase family protein [Saccharopolyspora erythraea]EQD84563.1 ADP-ribosylglycohydrolase [Saccharopolyspora erythraea D]PFG94576.1 ADP-ribosylglycohydrolase [Saccharopolyspora erythraea NRRL 2338]QRK91317.1 ADP-ribosylglycohydrolase family protein [Saccharopolyspora erythraea]CAM00789.1 ADP-ribosylglycohydrolase [Saccharopolyspora erythraea NRRL 2338]